MIILDPLYCPLDGTRLKARINEDRYDCGGATHHTWDGAALGRLVPSGVQLQQAALLEDARNAYAATCRVLKSLESVIEYLKLQVR